jgi:hypothetical protein
MRRAMYHYTSVKGFEGIISGGAVWLTSAHYMNDPTDCRWVFKLLREKIDGISDPEEKRILADFMLHCEINYPIPYIASFSSVNDDVSQWDRYADHGKGVCIEFKKEVFGEEKLPLHNVLRIHNLTVHPVEYNKSVHLEFVDKILSLVMNTYKKSKEGQQELEMVKAYCSTLVTQHSTIFKCGSYESEKEIRIIHTPFRFSGEIGSYEEGGCVGDLKIRESGYSEKTPYFMLEFPKEAIVSAIVGPKNDQMEALQKYTLEAGYEFPLYKSAVPFR